MLGGAAPDKDVKYDNNGNAMVTVTIGGEELTVKGPAVAIAKLRAGKLSDALNELKVIGKDDKALDDKYQKWLPAVFEEMNGSNATEGAHFVTWSRIKTA